MVEEITNGANAVRVRKSKGRSTTAGRGRVSKKKTPTGRKGTAQEKAWPPAVALSLLSETITGVKNSGLNPRVLNGAQADYPKAPTVIVYVFGAWQCPDCGVIQRAPSYDAGAVCGNKDCAAFVRAEGGAG